MTGARKPYGAEPWSGEALAAAVAQNYPIAGVLKQWGCGVSGTNYRWVPTVAAMFVYAVEN